MCTLTSAQTSRAFGRSVSVWKKARILIYFRTLNTCIKHPRECSYCPPRLFVAHATPNIAQCLRISEANHKYISYSHLQGVFESVHFLLHLQTPVKISTQPEGCILRSHPNYEASPGMHIPSLNLPMKLHRQNKKV